MLKVLSQNKTNSILAECLTLNAVKVLSYTMNGEPSEATAQTVYNVFSDLDFFRELGGKEQPQYAILPDGKEQSRRYFIVRFNGTNFLN